MLGGLSLMTICGRVEVMVADGDGCVFTGVGPFGWTRRFDWSEVSRIEEDVSGYQQSGSSGLATGSPISSRRRGSSGIATTEYSRGITS